VGQHAKVGDVSSFVGNVDLSDITHPLQRYMILDYIGENAVDELFHPAGKSEKKSAVVKKKTTTKAKYPPSFKGCKTCGNTDHNRYKALVGIFYSGIFNSSIIYLYSSILYLSAHYTSVTV